MFSLIHAQGSMNQANLIGIQHQVPWFSFLLFLINASMVEEFLYREIIWNLVSKLDIRVALTSVFICLSSSSRNYFSLVFICFTWDVFRDGAL